ncbi:hypothetical protein [Pontibacillus sp. HMF3514]|uniref:hypothetical protein n=1 Tax=Pontibacillus sp. HMF3514 TaxID=2692425 RepID=UPI00131F6BA5|nr:hypothetical protein [Pontibacillus sp. HMF3514]QHE51750.1 hypothetical protein GS400_06730 [Pontibacillus sp. HMF3514]
MKCVRIYLFVILLIISGYEVQYFAVGNKENYVLNTKDATYSLNVILSQTHKQPSEEIAERMVKQITNHE